jgi:hypothetical protein
MAAASHRRAWARPCAADLSVTRIRLLRFKLRARKDSDSSRRAPPKARPRPVCRRATRITRDVTGAAVAAVTCRAIQAGANGQAAAGWGWPLGAAAARRRRGGRARAPRRGGRIERPRPMRPVL